MGTQELTRSSLDRIRDQQPIPFSNQSMALQNDDIRKTNHSDSDTEVDGVVQGRIRVVI